MNHRYKDLTQNKWFIAVITLMSLVFLIVFGLYAERTYRYSITNYIAYYYINCRRFWRI